MRNESFMTVPGNAPVALGNVRDLWEIKTVMANWQNPSRSLSHTHTRMHAGHQSVVSEIFNQSEWAVNMSDAEVAGDTWGISQCFMEPFCWGSVSTFKSSSARRLALAEGDGGDLSQFDCWPWIIMDKPGSHGSTGSPWPPQTPVGTSSSIKANEAGQSGRYDKAGIVEGSRQSTI